MNAVYVDVFLVVCFLVYMAACVFERVKNKEAILRYASDPSFKRLIALCMPIFIVYMVVLCICLGAVCWRLLAVLTAYQAGGVSAWLLIGLLVGFSVYQAGLAQLSRLLLIFAKRAGI